jgi:hypothetical protein
MQEKENCLPMNEREAYESVKRDIRHFVESVRAQCPKAAQYLDKHIVMDDKKMTFAYTGGDRLKLRYLPGGGEG